MDAEVRASTSRLVLCLCVPLVLMQAACAPTQTRAPAPVSGEPSPTSLQFGEGITVPKNCGPCRKMPGSNVDCSNTNPKYSAGIVSDVRTTRVVEQICLEHRGP
jgi:hypothetical protein